ncbi:hypothetical protein Bca52824_000124 [Brassica carinata]|uniref:Uncharacterized protein n=1 Tax=Brassica carinata TaxID=52824 RepID=A0A8X8B8N8_BRACI|nr:hypothetical protein Bca52824_000124 [Brassica carinata]
MKNCWLISITLELNSLQFHDLAELFRIGNANSSRTPNKETPTIGSSFAQDILHPGAAMTTEERAGVTTQKEFVNVKRIIVISKAVLKLEQRATLPLSMMEIKLLKTQKLPEGKDNNSKTIASGSKFGGQVSYGGEHKGGMNCVRMKSVVESENETVTVVNTRVKIDPFSHSERYLQPVMPIAKHVLLTLQASSSSEDDNNNVSSSSNL